VFLVAVAAGTTLASVYFSPKQESTDPLLGPLFDFAAWCVLLLLCWRLATQAYLLQTEEQRLRIQREVDERTLSMRAAALTCTSHEVRTPLTGILSFTEMLLDESAGPLNELQKDFVSEIDRCGQHLMALVNDILDYAKAQSGQIKVAPEIVALPELVDQCVSMVAARAAKAEVKITTQIDAAVREIWADPLRLKQILLNLLPNAVKYSPAGGLVRIQVRPKGGDVVVGVRDTGRGITPAQLEHLFDPYYQATRGDARIGTGLGLAITKLLVGLHGGSISVDSAPESGSLFVVRLPVCPPGFSPSETSSVRQDTWQKAATVQREPSAPLCETVA
jgi:signal transduction histidine kinase